jgi:predicted dehydrogenase
MAGRSTCSRRTFLLGSLAVAAGARTLYAQSGAKLPASERIRVGCIGGGGRALSLVQTFSASPQCDVVVVADLDPARLGPAIKSSESIQGFAPRAESDLRTILNDESLDAVVIGTPDHWHAIPTILACQSGKDVYVEKPDGHNIVEGQRMVAAALKHSRVIQMGSQHRSTERLISALDFIRTGALGKCLVAKAWESTRQGSIGRPADSDPPAGIDYDLWLGPAPKRPFNRNRFHGNWRWFYDYGTGDLGNDGVHRLDMALACLNAALEATGEEPVGLPRRISATGGKWYFDDMQEFPDTLQVTYEFSSAEPGADASVIPVPQPRILTYEMRVWAPYREYGETEGAAIYGDQGMLVVGNSGWRALGPDGNVLAQQGGDSHERPHVENFIDCVKSRSRPACDLETIGHRASVLCHAGNIAARARRTLMLDPETEMFLDDADANSLRTRPEYRAPWLLPEV